MAAEQWSGVDSVLQPCDLALRGCPILRHAELQRHICGFDELGLWRLGVRVDDMDREVICRPSGEEIIDGDLLIRRDLVIQAVRLFEACEAVELLLSHREPRVAGLIVELDLPSRVGSLWGDAVVFRDPDPALHDVPRGHARLHRECAGVDNG